MKLLDAITRIVAGIGLVFIAWNSESPALIAVILALMILPPPNSRTL